MDQRAVSVEEKLCIIDRPAVALIDADRHDHVRRLRGLADGTSLGGRNCDRLFEQMLVLLPGHKLERRLHEGEIGIVWDERLREGCESNALFAQLVDLPHNLFDGALSAAQHRADLHGGSVNDRAHRISFRFQTRLKTAPMLPRVAFE